MMSHAEVSSLPAINASESPSPSGGGGGGGLHEATVSLATSACSDLARWALERNCLVGAPGLAHESALQSSHKHSNLIHRDDHNHNHHHHHHHHHFQQQQQQHQQNPHLYYGADLTINVSSATALAANQVASSTSLGSTRFHNDTLQDSLSSSLAGRMLEPMHQLESKLDYYTSDIWLSSGDERTNRLPFIGAGPWKLIYATIIYLCLIKWLLPRIMKPFKPLELNWLIRFYNLFMVYSNIWASYHGARIMQFGVKCFGCEIIDQHDRSPQAIELLHYGWLFFMSRIIEWLDTIFFVLRKKERQVTKLHVFHHSFVPFISWTYLKYHPGYTVAFFPLVNSFVHSIMYTYYFLATFGPKIQPYLWWKRYLTSLQIAQFVLILIQLASIPLTGDENCQYPRGFLYVAFAGAVLFLWLFYTYYLETYTKGKQQANHSKLQQSMVQTFKELRNASRIAKSQALGGARGDTLIKQQREGSSSSISEYVDNAIDCDELSPSSGSGGGGGALFKPKSN